MAKLLAGFFVGFLAGIAGGFVWGQIIGAGYRGTGLVGWVMSIGIGFLSVIAVGWSCAAIPQKWLIRLIAGLIAGVSCFLGIVGGLLLTITTITYGVLAFVAIAALWPAIFVWAVSGPKIKSKDQENSEAVSRALQTYKSEKARLNEEESGHAIESISDTAQAKLLADLGERIPIYRVLAVQYLTERALLSISVKERQLHCYKETALKSKDTLFSVPIDAVESISAKAPHLTVHVEKGKPYSIEIDGASEREDVLALIKLLRGEHVSVSAASSATVSVDRTSLAYKLGRGIAKIFR